MSSPFEHKAYHLEKFKSQNSTFRKTPISKHPKRTEQSHRAAAKEICPVTGFFVLKEANLTREAIQLRQFPLPTVRRENNLVTRETEDSVSANGQPGFPGKRDGFQGFPPAQTPRGKAVPIEMP